MARAERHRRGQRGQTLVMMVLGLVAMLAMLGVVIDGGYLWAQQRITQNSTDGAAEAGAVVLAERLAGSPVPAGGWDAEVEAKVTAAATASDLTITGAYYTDICGIPLTPAGDAALNADGTYNLSKAAKVGSGQLPADAGTTPDCPSLTVGPPAGVLVKGHKTISTFFAKVVGVNTMSVSTDGTAVSGWLSGLCDSSNGSACALLPVTVPVNPISCAGNGDVSPTAPAWLGDTWENGPTYAIPLCKEANGNVGWIDWTPPAGGTSELINSILHPNNPQIELPSWNFVSQTGNPNSKGVEDAIKTYDGQVVLIPMFDITCSSTPDISQVANQADNYGCSSVGGNGQQNWYRFPSFAAFRLCGGTNVCTIGSTTYTQGAYIAGQNQTICDSQNTQNWSGGGCLVGQFVNVIRTGPVSANGGGGGTSPSKAVGVQLIK